MNRFEGKSVLVTGGSSGIGLAAARAFATEGARVVITGRDATALEAAKVLLGGNALALRSDAGDPGAAKSLAAVIAGHGITLDALFILFSSVGALETAANSELTGFSGELGGSPDGWGGI